MKSARHRQIQQIVREAGECSVEFLTERLGVSDMTVRRDLQQLAAENRLIRTHGGASSIEQVSFEFQFLRNAQQHAAEKAAIGRAAAALVEDGQSIMLDSGTTTLAVARALSMRRQLTVITTSLPIAAALQKSDAEVILLGGVVRRDSPDLAGPLTESNLESFRADIAFVGADGVGTDGSLHNNSMTVGRLIAKMTARAGSVYAVADSSKVGRAALSCFGRANAYGGLITDSGLNATDRRALRKAGVKLILADDEGAL